MAQSNHYPSTPDGLEGRPRSLIQRMTPRSKSTYALGLLVIIFLVISIWNLGAHNFPSSDFTPRNDPEDIYLDLGAKTQVDKVFLLIQDNKQVKVDAYWGEPGSWTLENSLSQSGSYWEWKELRLSQETRYVRLVFKGASGRIGEVLLFSDESKLEIQEVVATGGGDIGEALIDEQDAIDDPVSHQSKTYFDEIYFARTAKEHLDREYPFEWSHPPLGKLLIATGIVVFGHDPFGWRIAGVLFAALMIIIVYLLAKRMFGSPRAGLIAAFLLTFDFMHFVEARIATGETFILFFIVCMFYFFYRYFRSSSPNGKDLFLSVLFFGLAFSTKWITLYGFVGMVILMLLFKWRKGLYKTEVMGFAGGLIAAAAVYIITYIPYFLADNTIGDFWRLQFDMFDYHSGLVSDHPFASEWWSWPIMLTPLWLFAGYWDGTTAYIATFGNPALWWPSIPMLLATLWVAVRHRDKTAAFIVIPFLTQWLFFIPIPRELWIYHFFPNLLFMILASTFWVQRLRGRWTWLLISYLALNVVAFGFFYPLISGHPMSEGYWDSLRWLTSWVL